jgi:hypothetical protein
VDRVALLNGIEALLPQTTANEATEAEATRAIQAATKLMDAHNIAMGEVLARDPNSNTASFDKAVAWESDTLHSHYFAALTVVEKVFAVKAFVIESKHAPEVAGPGAKTIGVRIVIFGEITNIPSAVWGLNFLGPLYRRLWDKYRVEWHSPNAEMLMYYYGLTDGFLAKLKENRAAQNCSIAAFLEHTHNKNALATLERRLQGAFEQSVKLTGVVKSSSRHHGGAFEPFPSEPFKQFELMSLIAAGHDD